MAHEFAIVALDGCMASCVTGVLDVLQVANGMLIRGGGFPAFSVRVATPSGVDATGFGGVPIRANASLTDLGGVDVVVLPPMLEGLDDSLAAHPDLLVWLKGRAAEGVLLTSVCTGAYFLAEAGLLDGRRATTYPGRATSFRRRYPNVRLEPDHRIVDEGSVISAGATTSYLDLALYLVDRYAGHPVAVATAKVLAVDKNRLTQRLSYLHRVRIEAAKRLLEETRSNVDEITAAVGYTDPRSFGRLFRRHTGMSPREYRRRFGVLASLGPLSGE